MRFCYNSLFFSLRWLEICGGNEIQQVHLYRGRLPRAAEFDREPAGQPLHDGGGVLWKRDRQGPCCSPQTQVRGLMRHFIYLFFLKR